MKASGPRCERETIVLFNDGGSGATIWTASQAVYSRLKKRGFELIEEGSRHGVFKCLKKQVKFSLSSSRRKGNLSALAKVNALRASSASNYVAKQPK